MFYSSFRYQEEEVMLKEKLEEKLEENMVLFEKEVDVFKFSCKFNCISSLLFQVQDVFQNRGRHFNNIQEIVYDLVKYNKDINIYCEKEAFCCHMAIVFFRNGDYSKEFLELILKLKNELLFYERIKSVKIIPI